MMTFQAFSEFYEIVSAAWHCARENASDADVMAPFLGPANVDTQDYARVQREFGWDDTH